ncbi:MAG: FAD-binding oxidoreductase [Actinobacteria bacterium]|nr:FAD-binding oxidoreductase [Actinomycetota bacterium]
MPRIAVAGAGQAGLQLALALRASGHEVTLATDRSAAEIAGGRILSTQCMFDLALSTERALGLDRWQEDCPQIDGVQYSLGTPDGERVMCFSGKLAATAQSVDQRLKMPRWLADLEAAGGRVAVGPLDVAALEELAASHDLLVVASTKGPIAKELPGLFARDEARSPFAGPQRTLGVAYVNRLDPLPSPREFSISIVPGVGEYFVGPALTLSGPCWTMCLEAIPGGPMDAWSHTSPDRPQEWLEALVAILDRHFPWEAERCRSVTVTDAKGTLAGAIAPVVRSPVGRLPSGRPVLGVGDAVVQNDPLVGQGANNAAKGATVVADAIDRRGGASLDDPVWLDEVAETFWQTVEAATVFTNTMLKPPEHVGALFDAGSRSATVANALAQATDDPRTLAPHLATPDGIAAFVAAHGG